MAFTYETKGTNTYLVYTIQPSDVIDTMELGMLTNNRIAGLATTLFTQLDHTKFIKYVISAKVPVSQFFAGRVNQKRLVGVFQGITSALLAAEDYMLDANSILLNFDYIYTDVSTCETELICLPLQHNREPISLGRFFKDVMFNTQFDQTENCDYVAKIINYLNSAPVFSLTDFKNVLEEISAPPKKQSGQPAQKVPAAPKAEEKAIPPQPVQQGASKPLNIPQQQVSAPAGNPAPVPQMQVPQAPARESTAQASAAAEKQVSLFYLLQHYNKENAALYREQKTAKKQNASASQKPQKEKKEKKKKEKKSSQKSATPAVQPAFAVPGQSGGFGGSVPNTQKTPATPQAPVAQQPSPQPAPPVLMQQTAPQPVVVRNAPANQTVHFGETTVLDAGGIGETTVLDGVGQGVRLQPHLLRAKNNERINITKSVFRIGKERSYVDYFIGDNTAVSRSHANILCKDGAYFVVDTNSTNHTYVDGRMIQSNAETQLSHGTKLRLANEEFEFRLY